MDCVDAETVAGFDFVARRNNSLSSTGRLFAFGLILIVSFGIAIAFTWVFGAWLILPFAGIEMLVLYLAFRYIERHAGDSERLAIDGDSLSVEVVDGGSVRRFEFNRHWASVVCNADGSRLALRSHGRELEIGRHLRCEQRLSMAKRLRRELRCGG
jgi:uncharacterized membrane protein